MTKDRTGKPTVNGLLPALLVAAGYYCGAKIGFALTFEPAPISILWPPNAILLSGLLLTPPHSWWLILLAVFPSHLATQLQSGVPLAMVLGWYVSNCSEAILGAVCVRRILRERLRFDSFRHVTVFLFYCAFLAPFASTFLDVIFVKILGWGTGSFWQLWQMRFFSNVVATLIVVPVLLAWNTSIPPSIRKAAFLRQLEGGLLVFALIGISGVVFISGFWPAGFVPVLLYAPVPILLWAAVRFESFITSTSFLLFAFFAVWGTLRSQGPFVEDSYSGNALSLQLFLICVSVPLWLLSAVIQERRKSEKSLRQQEEVLRTAIEARNKALEAERVSGARFAEVFRLSPDAMCISVDIPGRILDVNDRWQALFGYERAEVVGHTAQQLNLYASERDLAAVLDRDRERGFVRDLEVEMRDKDGCIRKTVISGGKIETGDESCFITILRDVTEQRRAESEARKQRELLTHLTRVVILGELSGALAHELNQPLAAILTNAQAARRFMNSRPVDLHEVREILDDIVNEDKRAGEVIRRLRALFMKSESKMQPLEINELVRDTLDLTHSDLIARKVLVILQLGSSLHMVRGDRIQLQQVLLNLIVNACEAMSCKPPEARRLTFATTESDMDGNVRIAVTDTGPGIAPDVVDKVFDSFFTTKAHGMGFGLSISHAIIAEHGGCIDAVNNPGGGATFRVTLPACAGVLS